jgi:hypothetical protein
VRSSKWRQYRRDQSGHPKCHAARTPKESWRRRVAGQSRSFGSCSCHPPRRTKNSRGRPICQSTWTACCGWRADCWVDPEKEPSYRLLVRVTHTRKSGRIHGGQSDRFRMRIVNRRSHSDVMAKSRPRLCRSCRESTTRQAGQWRKQKSRFGRALVGNLFRRHVELHRRTVR